MRNKPVFSMFLNVRSVALAAAIFVAFGYIYGITSEHLSHLAFDNNDAFFDADSYDTTRAMEEMTFSGDMQKHLIFSLVTSTSVRAVDAVAGLGVRPSILVTIAGLAALNIALCFLLLRVALHEELAAVAYATLYGVLLSNLVIFSLPETYSLSNLFILVYLAYLLTHWRALSLRDGMVLATVAGVASLSNPPLLSLVGIHTFIAWRNVDIRFAARVGILGSLLAIFIYTAAAISIRGFLGLRYPAYYFLQWASFGHFLEGQSIAHVVSSFLGFAAVSPVPAIEGNLEARDILGYTASASGGIAALAWLGLVASSIAKSVRGNDILVHALLVWIGLLAVFYLFFNPSGAILYSPQILVPLILIVATYGSRTFGPWNWIVAVVLAVLCGYHNFQAVMAAPTG